MNTVELSLIITEIKPRLKKEHSLEEKLMTAMKMASNHWVVLDEEKQFLGAVGAVMDFCGKDSLEYKRMEYTMKALQRLNTLVRGAQLEMSMSLSDALGSEEEKYEPVPLRDFWDKAKKEAKKEKDPDYQKYLELKEKYEEKEGTDKCPK